MAKKSYFKQTNTVTGNSSTTVLEVNKPGKFIKTEVEIKPKVKRPIWWKKWFILTGLTTILVLIVLTVLGVWWFVAKFNEASGVKANDLLKNYWQKKDDNTAVKKEVVTFLLLGLDQSENQRETSLLTDTMILGRLDKKNKTFDMVSLPRDLWIASLQTKINALYYYGQQNGVDEGVALVSSVVSEISGLPVDYYAVVNMDSLKQIIDAVGGVEVEVERSFEDNFYPREIDLSSTDPAVLYETVVFNSGIETMDGARALKYIRSRHSGDKLEGTDEGRELRQQRLLSALKQKFAQPKTITNPQILGSLYKVWHESFRSNLDEVGLISLAREIASIKPEIVSRSIPVQDASHSGLIFHPASGPTEQWVYMPTDTSWNEIKNWFLE